MNLYKKSCLLAVVSMLLGVIPVTATSKSNVTYEQRAEIQKMGRCFDLQKDMQVKQKIANHLNQLADEFLANAEELKKDTYFYLLKSETLSFDVHVILKKTAAGCDVQIVCFGIEQEAQQEVALLDCALKLAMDKKSNISTGKVVGGVAILSALAVAAVFGSKALRRDKNQDSIDPKDSQEDTTRGDYASREELNALKADIESALKGIPGAEHVEVLLWGKDNHKHTEHIHTMGHSYSQIIYCGPHADVTPDNNKKVKIILCSSSIHDGGPRGHIDNYNFGPLCLIYVYPQPYNKAYRWELDLRQNEGSSKRVLDDNAWRPIKNLAQGGTEVAKANISENIKQIVQLLHRSLKENKTW